MSNHLTNNEAAEPAAGAKRRRKIWLASGVAGLTGVVSLAAVGVATGAGAAGVDGLRWATAQVSSDGDQGRGDEGRDRHGKDDKDKDKDKDKDRKHDERVKEVPCNTDKLIQAIVFANDNHGATLELARNCTYNLTRTDEYGNGLPVITEDVTLKGDNTKIVRDATAEYFRILNVGPGGHLTLKGLTIKGGQTTNYLTAPEPAAVWSAYSSASDLSAAAQKSGKVVATPQRTALKAVPKATPKAGVGTLVERPDYDDGAGILVQPGGTADIEKSEILQNQSGGNGGGVANFGTTSIRQSTVAENTAFFFGGGIFNAGLLRVSEANIKNNEAGIGGAGISNGAARIFTDDVDGGTVWVEKTEISGNKTLGFGGGILDIEGDTTVKHSKITDNTALVAGGGIATAETSLNLVDVKVEKNSTLLAGGGLAIAFDSVATIEDSSIKDNVSAFIGGGLFVEDSTVTLRKSEVVGNRAVGPFGTGGGIFNFFGDVRLDKSKVAHNSSTNAPGGVWTNNGFQVDNKSAITANRPTNCLGSPDVPQNCFG